MDQYLTIQESAKVLHVAAGTLRRMIREGRLDVLDINPDGHYRQHRILLDDLKQLGNKRCDTRWQGKTRSGVIHFTQDIEKIQLLLSTGRYFMQEMANLYKISLEDAKEAIKNKGKEGKMTIKTKAHIRYKNQAGKRVPGVTTILSVLNKPALVKWANNLGLQGIDSTKYRDKMGDIGTLAHQMIMCHFLGKQCDMSEYSKDDIDKAENALLSFFEWEKNNKVDPILVEEPLVSEIYGYGGTIDLYAKLNGSPWLIDFKTSKALYSDMSHQVAAYQQLLNENSHLVGKVRILRIGRDESEGFEDKVIANLETHWKIFEHCLAIYQLNKEVR